MPIFVQVKLRFALAKCIGDLSLVQSEYR